MNNEHTLKFQIVVDPTATSISRCRIFGGPPGIIGHPKLKPLFQKAGFLRSTNDRFDGWVLLTPGEQTESARQPYTVRKLHAVYLALISVLTPKDILVETAYIQHIPGDKWRVTAVMPWDDNPLAQSGIDRAKERKMLERVNKARQQELSARPGRRIIDTVQSVTDFMDQHDGRLLKKRKLRRPAK